MNENVNSQNFAPVIIPTINRYKHFKACLESLERCKYAERTHIYVSLDYPPSDKYQAGWKKISEYLSEKEKTNGFLCLTVIRQTKNLGIRYPSNYTFLRELVLKDYDVFISTEDDNVFSYRFLEYMNLCLEKYKDDETIYAVTGYIHSINMPRVKASVVKLQEMSAWGCGFWKHKLLLRGDTLKFLDKMLADKNLKKYFLWRRPSIYAGLMHMKSNNTIWSDCFNTAYEYYTGKYCVYPITSLVQNHGWDGSGNHGGVVKGYSSQKVECEISKPFEIVEADKSETALIDSSVVRYWKLYEGGIHTIVDYIEIALYSFTGKIIMFDGMKRQYKKIRNRIQK